MPFPFVLSTTSHLSFQQHFTSSTHPSLPATATAQRNVLRATFKNHKRLPAADKASSLNDVLSSLTSYLKYLCTLDTALSGGPVNDEDVDLALVHEIVVEWRPTLSTSGIPGRDTDRVRGHGLDYEYFFVHETYAAVQNLLARQALLKLYASNLPSVEDRLALVQTATKHLKTAYSVHAFLANRANLGDGPPEIPPLAVDVFPSVQAALLRLSQAEFNLLVALKDDPYPAILVQARNELDREWMIKAPEIPKTRAQVMTRLCVGAAEHASSAYASLKAEKRISKDLVEYVQDLKRTARARACRFQAVDADARGETGKGIAWVYAGMTELGFEITTKDGSSKTKGLSKLKATFYAKREDVKIEKRSERWGSDAGKAEEARILEYLEKKFTKSNDTVHFQKVPEYKPLVGSLPSGMNMPMDQDKWQPSCLEEDELVQMRSPLENAIAERDSSGDEDDEDALSKAPAGAFPGTTSEYKESYY